MQRARRLHICPGATTSPSPPPTTTDSSQSLRCAAPRYSRRRSPMGWAHAPGRLLRPQRKLS
uniref:Uncharacterized protein n=1 Tax=Arundo donax TaxID=35708 RepID=A0A0A8ZIB2_ARUDO